MEEQQEGIIDEGLVFDLEELSDKELIALLKNQITKSESFWNNKKGFDLKQLRETNEKLWLGQQIDESKLYDHNARYIDNRIFTSTETIVSSVTARSPQPDVYPAQDTITSKQLAQDLSDSLIGYSEKYHINMQFKFATRHMLIYRLGCLKLRWDENIGENGEIVTEYVLPHDITIHKDARPGENPKFIAHYIESTIDEVVQKFPDSKDKIYKEFGIRQGTPNQLNQVIGYKEIWFSYSHEGEPQEGVCWIYKDTIVLGKMKNPNWNYSKSSEFKHNYFDSPLKPFIFFNHLNLGKYAVDDVTLIEQAKFLQDNLNKRGKQISENADGANSGWVFNSRQLSKDDAADIIGAPDEKIMVDGDVSQAVSRFPVYSLPSYVIEDKIDMRNEIDNIFATHKPSRGEETGSRTLGQDVLQKNQDFSRQDDIVRSIDDAADRYYQYLTQMMKVYYTKKHWFKISGENGQFDFVVMQSDNIEDGIEVRVKSGSTMPVDKNMMRATAMELVGLKAIDPLTLFEDLNMPNPQKRLERLITWTTAPEKFVTDMEGGEFDREAFMDIQILNAGTLADTRKEVTPEHLSYHSKYLMTGDYRQRSDKVKKLHVDHITLETEELRRTLTLEETQLPTKEETLIANQTIDEQNAKDMQNMPPGASTGMPPGTPQPKQLPGGNQETQPSGIPPQTGQPTQPVL